MKIRLHVNKNEMRKGKEGLPWTIHTSQGCTKAREVFISVPCRTEYKPEKRTNPKAFIVCFGHLTEFEPGRWRIEAGKLVL